MNKLCKDCLKNDVCKYIDDFDKFVKTRTEESEFAEVSVKCKFKQTESVITFREIERSFPTQTYPITPCDPIEPYPIITFCGNSTGSTDGDNINLK